MHVLFCSKYSFNRKWNLNSFLIPGTSAVGPWEEVQRLGILLVARVWKLLNSIIDTKLHGENINFRLTLFVPVDVVGQHLGDLQFFPTYATYFPHKLLILLEPVSRCISTPPAPPPPRIGRLRRRPSGGPSPPGCSSGWAPLSGRRGWGPGPAGTSSPAAGWKRPAGKRRKVCEVKVCLNASMKRVGLFKAIYCYRKNISREQKCKMPRQDNLLFCLIFHYNFL